ncbi:MAG: hypothetical protein K0Q94_4392 [Paenibacillus sp.]|jgi:uncharacterized membrane protein YgcG|nr:hypothetical protein [Paenibacillus sp.]
MELIFIAALIIVIVLFLITRLTGKNKSRAAGRRGGPVRKSAPPNRKEYRTGVLPVHLGLASDIPLTSMARELESAFQTMFVPQLKRRVLDKYPRMTEAEYDWKVLELKRYLLMNAVLRGVPMFSREVDDIWHEMLMFTREYETFCNSWYGRTVHHAPHGEAAPMPGERAWFDWVYSQLFVPTEYSGQIWRGFFRYPLDAQLLEEVERQSPDKLASSRFNRASMDASPEAEKTVGLLIGRLKEQIGNAKMADGNEPDGKPVMRNAQHTSGANHSNTADYTMLATSMVMFSVIDPMGYNEQMEEVLPEEEKKNQASCGSSSCSGTFGDDRSDSRDSDYSGSGSDGGSDGGSSGDSGSSGGSSSCSSSSCSSGCGGGGD